MEVLKQIRLIVFGVPVSILFLTVLMSFWNFDGLLSTATGLNNWILEHFHTAFNWATFAFVLTCLWVYVSPLGTVKIGGDKAERLLTPWQWFSITLCTTIAIGILFWATAEPIFHISAPPAARDLTPGSPDVAVFAMSSLYMHWSFTPYAIYTVPGLAFALAYYNLKRPFSLNGPLSYVLGQKGAQKSGDIIDAVALYSLVAGIAATLGAGMMSIAGGLAELLGVANSPLLQAAVTAMIVGAFVVSSVTGLHRGIRFLSNINARFFFLLCIFVFLAGPSLFMLSLAGDGLVAYVAEFLPRSLGMGDSHDPAWSKSWTVFYWANWLAWAPITALFLGRIARGYTVRQFILVNFVAPSLFAILWMTVLGGAAIHIDMTEAGALSSALKNSGPEAIAYEVLSRYPLSGILIIGFVLLSFISYVTAADSNTDAIANVCQKDADTDRDGTNKSPLTVWLKVTFAVLMGAAAWIMTAYTGIDGVRMMSNLGGLPALFIVLLMNVALILFSTKLLPAVRKDS